EVERRRLALDIGVGRQDDLGRLAALEPDQELLDLEVVGTDAVERRQGAEQHVVAPAVLARPLHRQEVVLLFDDAEQARVARGIGGDAAGGLGGDVEAGAAGADPLLQGPERLGGLALLLDRAIDHREPEPPGPPRSDAGAPPAVASTRFLTISSCIAAICCCSRCASFMMIPNPLTDPLLPAGAGAPRPPRPGTRRSPLGRWDAAPRPRRPRPPRPG